MRDIDHSSRVPWLGSIAALLFVAAIAIGLLHPFGVATSDTIGLALLLVVLLCLMTCRV